MNFSEIVCQWYKKNQRDLPWRRSSDPYLVWISEIILQQTRVSQGLDYYLSFAGSFPDLHSLAAAPEDRVLKLWQGLGYYSRARNMHAAAKKLVAENKGMMPGSYEGLLEMKGVGTYTASAIASICYGEAKAVVDGNVSRVISRIYGVEDPVNGTAGKRIIDSLAAELMAESTGLGISPGTHNQAMMEFGALQCVPRSPACESCPLAGQCNASLSGRVDKLPVKIPKAKALERWMYFYIIIGEGETILTRRGEQGIWRSLYHFPVVESTFAHPEEEICGKLYQDVLSQLAGGTAEQHPNNTTNISASISAPMCHLLSHRTIYARFIQISLSSLPSPLAGEFIRVPLGKLEHYPVPRLMERYMEVAKF